MTAVPAGQAPADDEPGRDDAEVRRWAETLIGQLSADPLPVFGSAAWVEANGSVRLASAVRAALARYEDTFCAVRDRAGRALWS